MSIEGTSRAQKSSPEGCGKKSKKGHKKKVPLGAEKEDAECNNEVPELDETVLNTESTNEVQSMPPLKKSKLGEKMMKDVTQPKEGKQVKFNLESTIMPSDQGKRDSVQNQIVVHANEAIEENMPYDTSWVQRASWKSLVGESGRVAFILSSMLGHNPSLLPSSNEKSMSASVGGPSMDVQSSNNVSAWIDGSTSAPSFESSRQSNKDSRPLNRESVKTPVAKGGLIGDPLKIESAKQEDADGHDAKQVIQNNCQSGGEKVCMFMQSDNYEQEWLEAKRAVKEIFKRSRKDALKSMKMFHTKHYQ